MLEVEKLFNKQPFIYFVDGIYYAFGVGVCARCDKYEGYVTLPLKYQRYADALKNEKITQEEATEIYRKLRFIANGVKDKEEHFNLTEKFLAYKKEIISHLEGIE